MPTSATIATASAHCIGPEPEAIADTPLIKPPRGPQLSGLDNTVLSDVSDCTALPVGTCCTGDGTGALSRENARARERTRETRVVQPLPNVEKVPRPFSHEQWARRGANVKLLDAKETEAKVGTKAYAGSLLDLRAGTIQPLAYVRGLAHAAITAGATVFTGSPVIGAEEKNGKWVVKTAKGSVTANWVVVATNAYTNAPWPEVRAELVHLPYFNMATKPLSDNIKRSILPERQGVWDTKEVLSSFRFDQQGRLVFGSVGALRNTGAAVHKAWAKKSLKRLFPQIGEVEFEAEWYGKIGMTNDSLPKFHRLARNVVGFSGYNGRGIAPGTVFGKLLSQLVSGEINEDDLPLPVSDPKEQNFRGLREAYYEAGAQVAHVAEIVI